MAALATIYTENHGHLEARTTEYAQDKMEQLLAIAYTDAGRQYRHVSGRIRPAAPGWLSVAASNTAAPVNGYVDWLAQDGSLLGGGAAPPATWFYERVWQSRPRRVRASSRSRVTAPCARRSATRWFPKSTVVALKSSQF